MALLYINPTVNGNVVEPFEPDAVGDTEPDIQCPACIISSLKLFAIPDVIVMDYAPANIILLQRSVGCRF